MKHFRHLAPFFGILALVVLFLKLPEVSKIFNGASCKTCVPLDPYLPLFGAAYFTTLMAISMLFPKFPGPQIARSGLIFALLLALVLTYIDFPRLCVLCLIGHGCNILIWAIWVLVPSTKGVLSNSPIKERLCLVLSVPISVVALFSCLNLTLMVYSVKADQPILTAHLQIGDPVPPFSIHTSVGQLITSPDSFLSSRTIINFISPDCPYCQEQIKILDTIIPRMKSGVYRFINITPFLPSELISYSSFIEFEWIEDKAGDLRKLFKVSGYPTLFAIGDGNKIVQIIPGINEDLKKIVDVNWSLD